MPIRETLQKLIAADDKTNYRGEDWWQLSEAEEEVFSLELSDMPRFGAVWLAYEACCGIIDASDGDLTEEEVAEERAAHPELFDIGGISHESFRKAAAAWCGLSSREADAMYQKHHFWNVRCGITTYNDEV